MSLDKLARNLERALQENTQEDTQQVSTQEAMAQQVSTQEAMQEVLCGHADYEEAYWMERYGSVPPRGGRPLTPKEKEEITKQLKEWEARWMEEVTKEKDGFT